MTDAHLIHYGVKGMKWGVTRRKGANGRVASDDFKSARVGMKKKQFELSNSELKKINERLQLERNNRDLQSRGALQKIKTGTAIAGTILAVGTTISTAYNLINSPVGQKIKQALENS